MAGYPEETTVYAINRLCSSGLQAVATIANEIRAGQIQIGIGGGVESMSQSDMNATVNAETLSDEVFENEKTQNCMVPMGITSENVAAKYNITRKMQD